MKKLETPCIDICKFTGPNQWCVGCGRTRQECDYWKKMKPYDRRNLINELRKRMSQMNAKNAAMKNK